MAYVDYIGKVVADFPNFSVDIIDVAKDIGIKIDDLTIIGFKLFAGENHPKSPNNTPPEIIVYLLTVHNSTWEGKYNTIGEYLEQEKTVQVVELNTNMNLNDFHAKYLKRFEGELLWKNLQDHKLIINQQD